jgi:hypothetical protein
MSWGRGYQGRERLTVREPTPGPTNHGPIPIGANAKLPLWVRDQYPVSRFVIFSAVLGSYASGPRDGRRGPVPGSQTPNSQDSGSSGQLCHSARLCAAGSDRSKASDANEEPATAVEERNRGQIGGPIARFELARARTLRPGSILSGTAGNLQDRAIAPGATSDERHRRPDVATRRFCDVSGLWPTPLPVWPTARRGRTRRPAPLSGYPSPPEPRPRPRRLRATPEATNPGKP